MSDTSTTTSNTSAPAVGSAEPTGDAALDNLLYADHIKERRDGGDLLDPENGQALCAAHHTRKTASERMRRLSDRCNPLED